MANDDLIHMIAEAETHVRAKAAKEEQPPTPPRTLPLKPLLAAVVLVLFCLMGYEIWETDRPSSTKEIARDLQVAVDLAHGSIEDAKSANGHLPDALPSASLASVVHYEPDQTGYRLTASNQGVRVTLESDGEKIVTFVTGAER